MRIFRLKEKLGGLRGEFFRELDDANVTDKAEYDRHYTKYADTFYYLYLINRYETGLANMGNVFRHQSDPLHVDLNTLQRQQADLKKIEEELLVVCDSHDLLSS
jgi:lantibiotic modifying enzyme